MRALVMRPGQTGGELVDIEPTLEPLKELVGGWLEAVDVGAGWHVYFDEEGKLKGLDLNAGATLLLRHLGWRVPDIIVGPAVFLGTDYDEGDERDVPQAVLDTARQVGLLAPDGDTH